VIPPRVNGEVVVIALTPVVPVANPPMTMLTALAKVPVAGDVTALTFPSVVGAGAEITEEYPPEKTEPAPNRSVFTVECRVITSLAFVVLNIPQNIW